MKPRYYVAFYKGRKRGFAPRTLLARFTDWLTRVVTKGEYSHCEIAIWDGKRETTPYTTLSGMESYQPIYSCYSSSFRDRGVRTKEMPLPADKWDLYPIPSNYDLSVVETNLNTLWLRTKGLPYDFFGAIGVVIKTRQSESRWFCSEWCGRVLGFPESWRLSPNDLAAVLKNNQSKETLSCRLTDT